MFAEIKVDDLKNLYPCLYHLKGFLFRGQVNSEWTLSPKLERLIKNSHRTNLEKETIEKSNIEKCQKNAHLYISNLPSNNDYFSWFSLMQHYGGPTRLLDFTYSPYIALFFAIYNYINEENIALWCINGTKLWKKVAEYFSLDFTKGWLENFRYHTSDIFNETIFDENAKKTNSILILEQKANHQRIAIQQGLFLTSLDDIFDFYDCLWNFISINEKINKKLSNINIQELKGYSIIKIIINKAFIRRIALELRMMNITAESMFPGFDGFIQSFNLSLLFN